MPIDGNAYSPSVVRVGVATQSTFGTANQTQGDFLELHITDVPSYDPLAAYIVDDTMRHDGQHVLGKDDSYKTTAGGTSTFQVSFLATYQDLLKMLPALFQNETLASPLATYTWDESTDKSSGTSLELLTILVDDPEDNYELHSMVLKTLEITVSPDSDGGRVRCTATLITGFPETRGATSTPALWTAPSNNWFAFGTLGTMQINSEDFVLTSGSFTFENNAVRIGNGAAGIPEGYVMGVANKKGWQCSGSVTALYDGVTEGWLALAKENYAVTTTPGYLLSFIWGAGLTDGELRINLYVIVDNADLAGGGDMGMERTIPFRAIANGTNDAVSVVLDNNSGA